MGKVLYTVKQGFQQMLRNFGLVLGFFLANSYYGQLAPHLEFLFGRAGLASLAAYLGIFLGTMAAVSLIAALIRKLLRMIMLGWLDIIGGGALGLFKGALLCCVTVMALTAFLPPKAELLANSRLLPYVNEFGGLLSETLPQEMRDRFVVRSRELQKEWERRVMEQLKERRSCGQHHSCDRRNLRRHRGCQPERPAGA